MKLRAIALLGCLGFALSAHANEVLFTSNQPLKITFRVAHKNQSDKPVFGELQSVDLSKNVTIPIPVPLDNYDRAGIIIVSVNGHELPPSANQFDQREQCSMTTNKSKPSGALEFTLSPHSINCHAYGGVFY